MSILLKAIYRVNVIPIKIPRLFFLNRTRTNNPKVYMEPQKTPNSQSNLEKKNKAGGITFPDFRLYYKATLIKTAQCWYKNRHIA